MRTTYKVLSPEHMEEHCASYGRFFVWLDSIKKSFVFFTMEKTDQEYCSIFRKYNNSIVVTTCLGILPIMLYKTLIQAYKNIVF